MALRVEFRTNLYSPFMPILYPREQHIIIIMVDMTNVYINMVCISVDFLSGQTLSLLGKWNHKGNN